MNCAKDTGSCAGYPSPMGETTALAAESFCDVVREHARSQGDVAAFTYAGEDISFAEIDAGADRVANGLAALGVKPGDRVAFLGKNHHSISRPSSARTASAR